MRFTVFLTTKGLLATGLVPKISIWSNTKAGVVGHPVLFTDGEVFTEMGEGLYYYDYAAANNDDDYSAIADSTLAGYEKYAPCISTVQGDVALTRAIEAGNWRIDRTGDPHVMNFYDENDDLIRSFNLTQAATEMPQYETRVVVP